ncbi:MAG: sialate O-acetylesterase [Pyrinomonadaceae bacterium]|nr:sialate O-acetylesterase [Sphingobacteriaceae bacterium]
MKNYSLNLKTILLFILFLCLVKPASAKIILPNIFSDNMVLQQKTKAAIWGTAEAGRKVSITTSWNHKRHITTPGVDGKWQINVATPAGGGPYDIRFSDGTELILNNVLIGEVWLCSGQSNMEMPLQGWGKINDYKMEIASANYPNIRLLQVVHATSNVPFENAAVSNGGWEPCSSQSVADFSSVAYFFARKIYEETKVPIGLINSSWGGTIAEAWTSAQTLKEMPDFEEVKIVEVMDNNLHTNEPNRPSVLYNAMIHPFIRFSIRGAIWYQGESNVSRAYQYRELFPAMIKDWRSKFHSGDFPFYFVQLANYMKGEKDPTPSDWAELREAQLMTTLLPHTGMAVTIDIGLAENIHPKNKQDVGYRLALIALAKTYRLKVQHSGPIYKSQKIMGNEIRLRFRFSKNGLKTKDNAPLTGFAIAGIDQKFYWASAKIEGNELVVSSPDVPNPVAVRYGWSTNPDCNLYNGVGLPASPFRTDQWKGLTWHKK